MESPFIVLCVIFSACQKCGLSIHFKVWSRTSFGTGNSECLSGEYVLNRRILRELVGEKLEALASS